MAGDEVVAELDRRVAAEGRIAAALVELERHPGHQFLSSTPLTGASAQRWTAARESIGWLWDSFTTHQRVVADAGAVLARRARPGPAELAELRALLQEPTIEVSRRVVERRIDGDRVEVDTITLGQLAERMDVAFRGVRELVETAAARHRALLDGLEPLAARATAARSLARELGVDAQVVAITERIDALDREGTADPLGLAEGVLARRLGELDAELRAIEVRLAEQAAQRAGWEETVERLTSSIAALGPLHAGAVRARGQAVELIVGDPAPIPPERSAALQQRLQRLDAEPEWSARVRAAAVLRADVDAATAAAREALTLAEGLLARRSELRGRYEAYRAKAIRTGNAERPELLALDDELRATLWTKPCDLAAATRLLVRYQRLLQTPHDSAANEGRSA